MNYKLEKFWNILKGFRKPLVFYMNYKLEKFWNSPSKPIPKFPNAMNYKLEKFWNLLFKDFIKSGISWTINLKSFEIEEDKMNKIWKKDEL